MSDDLPALRKRLAEFMGWKTEYGWQFPAGYGLIDDWHPDEDIAQAFMAISATEQEWGLHCLDGKYEVTFIESMIQSEWEETPALAISLAADSWLRQGGSK